MPAARGQLYCDAFAFDFTCWRNGRFAAPISPDSKSDKQKIKYNKRSDVRLATDAESITVQSFAQNKVHAVPRHQHCEKTNHARDRQAKLCPPTGQPAVQRQYVTEQRNQRPGLFRVPAPKPAPGIICPDAAENSACTQT